MNAPKYWKNMHVDTTNEDIDIANSPNNGPQNTTKNTTTPKISKSQIISKNIPLDFDKEFKDLTWECHHPYTQQQHSDISSELVKFINANNQMYTGVYELVNEELFETFIGFETYVLILRFPKNNKIMGTMISVVCTTSALKNTKIALTSYLCIHKKLRGKALCMMVIRKALKEAHSRGMLCSYYLQEKPFSGAALSVERWMRPINVPSALDKGFEFVMPVKNNKRKYKYAYLIANKLSNDYRYDIVQTNKQIAESFKFVYNLSIDKAQSPQKTTQPSQPSQTLRSPRLLWIPTKKEWRAWCKSKAFDTIIVYKNDNIIGVVTIQQKQIFIPETKTTAKLTFVPYHCVPIDVTSRDKHVILESAIIHSKNLNVNVMFVFESGIFDKSCMEMNKVVQTGKMFIDFYNYKHSHSIDEIMIPLL